jgi:hypothetical protein
MTGGMTEARIRAQDVRALLTRAATRGASVPASLAATVGSVTVNRADLRALVDAVRPARRRFIHPVPDLAACPAGWQVSR